MRYPAIALTLLALFSGPVLADSPRGDVDGDGFLTWIDLTHVVQMSIQGIQPKRAADFNRDGKVNVLDVILFVKYLSPHAKGDPNGDKVMDLDDVKYVLNAALNSSDDEAADITGDGTVNVIDVQAMNILRLRAEELEAAGIKVLIP